MESRRTCAVVFAVAAIVFTSACGDEPPTVSTEPETAGSGSEPGAPATGGSGASAAGQEPTAPDELVATCGAVRFNDLPADPSSFPPLGDVEQDVDLTPVEGEHEFFEIHDWHIASESDDELVLFGIPHEQEFEAAPYADATLVRQDDSWVPSSWGQCRIDVSAEGWGHARFVLDPDVEPDPSSVSVAVQAWEVACASGQAPDGREVRPVVLSQDAISVSIVVLVEPVRGDAECPGNPSFSLEIELDEALGERSVFDASTEPALKRPWPPTESSLLSDGMDE
ncbi:hypothetical protein [Phytoactinopolyspora mesophila]|uniref:Uncharacterized protein n=1 Tax=Phytoactinopolyspora mesophila TaxID=2650750 RepID=A0A7K3M906_9ACTN|nr:hypothetical protein [Phytoactinopolyspora mesophila]NDL59816.1 hypothetical protein [Phytoactinopolyspora mesophila]